ncbi:GDP-L-fucose synthase [Candidatus Kaiserbacteria bacterium]|nr:GDP-L-fucose synthase [Candidatus Kaiserbacteria bacterium]
MGRNAKIYVAGHRGLVGSALVRALTRAGYKRIITRTHAELELLDQAAVLKFFEKERPEYVFLAAAKVGGIMANKTFPADFIRSNLAVQMHAIHAAHTHGVKKFLFLGSSCIYPKLAPQPIPESALLTSELEETNMPYAIAKIAGIVMCQSYNRQHGTNYISVMPTNLYGPNDNYDLETSHVLPALLRRFHEAKEARAPSVTLWGTGSAKREFLHVDDLADACLFLMHRHDGSEIINIGSGEEVSIKELAETISEVVGYAGEIRWDSEKPDGTPRKLLDVSKLHALGWRHSIPLIEGLRRTYETFRREV